jgi:hypothetical protein
MFWIVNATVVERTPYGSMTRQVPMFYLNGRIQGITDADTAMKVAKEVIDPAGKLEVHASVEPIEDTIHETSD